MVGLLTPLVLRNSLLGCVLPRTLRTHPRVIEIFDALSYLLLHDHVTNCFVYHSIDIPRHDDDVDSNEDALPVAKLHLINGLLNNLPTMIYFNNMLDKFSSSQGYGLTYALSPIFYGLIVSMIPTITLLNGIWK